jgi:hypothetical protein
LLAHGRWFSPATPASSITKTGRHDIAKILLKMALRINQSIKQASKQASKQAINIVCEMSCCVMVLYCLYKNGKLQ